MDSAILLDGIKIWIQTAAAQERGKLGLMRHALVCIMNDGCRVIKQTLGPLAFRQRLGWSARFKERKDAKKKEERAINGRVIVVGYRIELQNRGLQELITRWDHPTRNRHHSIIYDANIIYGKRMNSSSSGRAGVPLSTLTNNWLSNYMGLEGPPTGSAGITSKTFFFPGIKVIEAKKNDCPFFFFFIIKGLAQSHNDDISWWRESLFSPT